MPKVIPIAIQKTVCELYKMGKPRSQIAQLFNISCSTVLSVIRRNNIPVQHPEYRTSCRCNDNYIKNQTDCTVVIEAKNKKELISKLLEKARDLIVEE